MNIAAADFKRILKRLSPAKTDIYRFDVDGIIAQDSDVIVAVQGPSFGGTFNTNGKNLSKVVSRMSGQIDITQESNKLILKSAKARIELEIQPVKSAPLPEASATPVVLNTADLKKALGLAVVSASTAKAAAFGGVVQIQSQPNGYRVVGTDNFVITVVSVKQAVPEFKTLLNLTAASIVQIMDGETVTIQDAEKYVVLKSGDTAIYASKSVHKYPNVNVLLDMPPLVKLGFKTEEWLSAFRTAESLVDEEKDKGAVIGLFRDGVVQWSSIGIGSTASDEAAYEQLEPDPVFEPKEVTLKLTAKYLSGFLSRAGETGTLGISDKPLRLESGNVVVLTMPMMKEIK